MGEPPIARHINMWNNFIKAYLGIILLFAAEDLIAFGVGRSGLSLWIAIPLVLILAAVFARLLTYPQGRGLTGSKK